MRLGGFLALIVVALAPAMASAATISVVERDGAARVIVTGPLISEDVATMKMKIGPYARGIVEFNSDGGSVIAGIQIGEMVRSRNFSTLVPDNAQCSSACALAWLGGMPRFMGANAEIGFHAVYRASTGRESGVGNALVGAYLNRMGLPDSAVVYITQSAPDSMTWLSLDDAARQGIDVQSLKPESRHAKTNSNGSIQQTTGLDLQQRAMNFVLGLMEQLSDDPASALRFLGSVYATELNYYGTLKDREAVMKSKRQLFRQWPVRKYAVKPDTLRANCDTTVSVCRVTGAMDWTRARASEQKNEYSKGSSEFQYDLMLSERGFGIVAESSTVISQRTTGEAPAERPRRTPSRKWPPFDWPIKWLNSELAPSR